MADISSLEVDLYGGKLKCKAAMNITSDNMPFKADASLQDVRIEKLKTDTKAKDKDISGAIAGNVSLTGYYAKPESITGGGSLSVKEGKLWELDLFKGLGSVIFTDDFANIVFNQGSCDFIVENKFIASENLLLVSNIANLKGPFKIGFDNSVEALFDVEVLDEMVPLTGTFRDVTTAIAGQAGKFGAIQVSGTLNDPKYKFKSPVIDLIKGITNTIFGR